MAQPVLSFQRGEKGADPAGQFTLVWQTAAVAAPSPCADLPLAALYDTLNPWGPGDDFCLDLVMSAGSVLDVGCGTGQLLLRAHEEGHRGRLMGLDPAPATLVQARRAASGVERVLGDLRTRLWAGRASS